MIVVLVGMTKLKYMPYMHFYLDQIDLSRHEVKIVYWDRDETPDIDLDERIEKISFNDVMSDDIALSAKVTHLRRYSKFVNKCINEVQPDKLVVLHSTTGILMYNMLTKKYKHRYIFDYRDVTYEDIWLYRRMIWKLFQKSSISFTSSNGFRKYFPPNVPVHTSHNLTMTEEPSDKYLQRLNAINTPIRIGFWGLMRHYDLNKVIISKIGNDNRFELHYYGRAQGEMLTLLQEAEQKYTNVHFHGEYVAKDKDTFAANIDLMHNIYDNSDRTTPLAMGNKYYDGLSFFIPSLTMRGSYMGKETTRANIGIECDPNSDTFLDDVFAYYRDLDRKKFIEYRNNELNRILHEIEEDGKVVRQFVGE